MKAFLRLFFITLGVFIVLSVVIVVLRYVGAQREFAPYDHPLLNSPAQQSTKNRFWIVAEGGGGEKFSPYTESALRDATSLAEGLKNDNYRFGVQLPLRRSREGVWFVHPHQSLSSMTNHKGAPENLSWDELVKLSPFIRLHEAINYFPQHLLILDFFDPNGIFVQEVAKLIRSLGISERVVLRSPFSKFVRELKKIEPLWLYGSDSSSIVRAMFFDVLSLETLITFREDIVVAPFYLNGGFVFTPSLIKEIKRQYKNLILDLSKEQFSIESSSAALPIHFDILPQLTGVITLHPRQMVEQIRRAAQ